MGYYTDYTLSYKWEEEPTKIEELEFELALHENYNDEPLKNFIGGNANSHTWYEYAKDMSKLSKRFPKILLTMEGSGEESGDLWINYFKNGKIQRCPARIEFDEYDPLKLKEIE